MRLSLIFLLLVVTCCGCSLGSKTTRVLLRDCSTLREILKIRKMETVDLSCFKNDLHEIKQEAEFTYYSYFKKKEKIPYLIIKLKNQRLFMSALYYPAGEMINISKDHLFELFTVSDWKREEEQVSPDDKTLKVYFLSKLENILFAYYEINQKEIHFISVGSSLEPETIKDLFIF